MRKVMAIMLATLLAVLVMGLPIMGLVEAAHAEPVTITLADLEGGSASPGIDLTPIVQAAVVLISGIITAYVVPWLKSRYTGEQLSNASYWVRVLVAAAEQLYVGQGRGEDKLAYVQGELAKRGIKLDTDAIKGVIESEVYWIKRHQPVTLVEETLEIETETE